LEALLPGGQRLHWPTIFGMLIGLCGAALLVAPDILGHGLGQNTLAGFLILQVGMSSWSLGSIFQKRQESTAHPIVVGAVHQLAPAASLAGALVHEHPIMELAVACLVAFGRLSAKQPCLCLG
jgi:drug/metabolite transporter (DMT)-like permease